MSIYTLTFSKIFLKESLAVFKKEQLAIGSIW